MSNRLPDPSDPFEDEGLAAEEAGEPGKRITGDPQDDMAVPGDTPLAVNDYGTTAEEERQGEPLDLRLSREQPELSASVPADTSENSDRPYPEDPEERAGRLVETDEGARGDDEATAVAHDVGTDRGGFSAEERAIRLEPEP